MPPNGHAALSASSSNRWLHCPPSVRIGEGYADKGSDFAAEGTDAHTLGEYKIRRALGQTVKDPTEHLAWYSEEMEDCATGYAAYVNIAFYFVKTSCSPPEDSEELPQIGGKL